MSLHEAGLGTGRLIFSSPMSLQEEWTLFITRADVTGLSAQHLFREGHQLSPKIQGVALTCEPPLKRFCTWFVGLHAEALACHRPHPHGISSGISHSLPA